MIIDEEFYPGLQFYDKEFIEWYIMSHGLTEYAGLTRFLSKEEGEYIKNNPWSVPIEATLSW